MSVGCDEQYVQLHELALWLCLQGEPARGHRAQVKVRLPASQSFGLVVVLP